MQLTPFFFSWILLVLLSSVTAVGSAEELADPRVIQFTPQGTVKRVRQVSVRFSEPMVPLGDPRGAIDPFEIACAEAGTGRWADSRNWIYDFVRDLPAGVRCAFRIRTGLTTLAGKAIVGQQEFAFSTGGPAIQSSTPVEGSLSIDEEQVFILVLDAEPIEPSILEHVSFSVEGIAERVGVDLVTRDRREEIFESLDRWTQHAIRGRPTVVLQARQRFPNLAKVSLVWGRGVTSQSGVLTEQDQVLPFQVRGPFSATFHCEREHKGAPCIPVTPMMVQLSAAVAREQAQQIVLEGRNGRRWRPEPWEEKTRFVSTAVFKGPFPESSAFRIEIPRDLKDDAGRPLVNADKFPLAVNTGPFPPLAKFSARFGIVEWKADPALPVTLRNLEPEVLTRILRVDRGESAEVKGKTRRIAPEQSHEVLPWLRKVAETDRDRSVFGPAPPGRSVKEFKLPKPEGAHAFEVIGIPLETPGLYVVELESPRLGASLLGKPKPMFVPTAALVTDLSVHFKWGRETSLVWVTTLDTGRPVPEALVTVQDCKGKVLWKDQTDANGIARVGGLPSQKLLPRCPFSWETGFHRDYEQKGALTGLEGGLLVTAQTGDDLSFVHTSWDGGIEPWRFQLPVGIDDPGVVAHTVFDRSLYRAGETVRMKHLLRVRTLQGFSLVSNAAPPTVVSIRHLGSQEKYEFPLAWDAAGVAETVWQIPKEVKLGSYQVVLLRPATKKETARSDQEGDGDVENPYRWGLRSGGFRVEEFRVPLMKAILQPPVDPLIEVSEFPVDLSLQYLAGGGASNHPVTLRAQLGDKWVSPPEEFEGFTFANGPVKEGLVRRGVETRPDDEEGEGEEGEESQIRVPEKGKPTVHQRLDLILDAAGTARATIARLPRASTPRQALLELEYRDPNGEVQTVSSTVPLWPSKRLVGIRPDSWVASRDSLKARVAVIDVGGRPQPGVAIQVDLLERKYYSHRKRLVGGFYAYDHTEEVRRVGMLCGGETNAKGLFLCEGQPPVDGNLILQASLTEDSGDRSAAHQEVWVAGSEQWWFKVRDSDRIDLLPEKRRYEPAETARLQVRMPFREATALVAVEREGVAETFVVPLSGKEPVIEVPVKAHYAPNIFISVLAVRGRVGDVQPTALVDLGKPSFKLGIAELRVGWRAHELRVKVSSDRTIYRVREMALVRIAVRTVEGQPPPPGSEVALAAVDEGLLELAPNMSWDLLEAMMGRRSYQVRTSTAQMQVVGKRHFGLKALPQGGGGGRQTTRELFDTLLLWKGRVSLDAEGNASVEVPLNDSLTGFRIVAVATGGVGLFGTGSTTIRSTQDLMVLTGIAPLVREGDRVRSEVTLRNTTDRAMEIAVVGRVDGLPEPLEPQALTLAPGEAKAVAWEITAPLGVRHLQYEVEAAERGGQTDRVRVTQQVVPAVPVRTYQATLFRWEGAARQTVERPVDAVEGRGGVQVSLRSTLIEGLDGVREWMTQYPYTCLEQRVSRAVALRDEALWREIVATLPAHLDSDGLLKYFPRMWRGSDVLTSYVLAISHEAGWRIPDQVVDRMVEGLRQFVEGRIIRGSALPTADLSIRKLTALEALSRYGKAEARLLSSVAIEPNLWPTSAVIDWRSLLHRLADARDRGSRLREAEQILRSRLNFQGTTMGFSTERADHLWWCMVSADTNAIRLILHLLEFGEWKEDLPRLMRGALGRQRRGAWDLTLANAWGVLAVEKFSHTFEATPITGTSLAALAEATKRVVWEETPKGRTVSFPWPSVREELTLDHVGTGHPWITVQAQAAIPLTRPLSSGYRIERTLTPIEQRSAGRLTRGDLVRVRLTIEAQTDMTWVVVSDPIPAGASHLGTGLARDSRIARVGEERKGWAWPAFEERAFEAFRAYYEYVPKGEFVVEYTIRLNQSGRFHLPTTRVEALYAPEVFGEIPNSPLEVHP